MVNARNLPSFPFVSDPSEQKTETESCLNVVEESKVLEIRKKLIELSLGKGYLIKSRMDLHIFFRAHDFIDLIEENLKSGRIKAIGLKYLASTKMTEEKIMALSKCEPEDLAKLDMEAVLNTPYNSPEFSDIL